MKSVKCTAAVMAALMLASAYPIVTSNSPYTFGIECSAAEASLPAPGNIKAKIKDNTVILSWDKVDGADAYRIYTYDAAKKKYVKYKSVTGTKTVIKDLKKGTSYKFKVAALKKNGRSYTVGTVSKAVTAGTAKSDDTASVKAQKKSFKEISLSAKELAGALEYYDFRYLSDISRSGSYDPSKKEWTGSGYMSSIQVIDNKTAFIVYEDTVDWVDLNAASKKLGDASYKIYTDGTDNYLFYSFKNGDGSNTYIFKQKVHSTFEQVTDTSLLEGKWTSVDFCQTDIDKNSYDPTSPVWLWDFYMIGAEAANNKMTFYYSSGEKSSSNIGSNKIGSAKYALYSVDDDLYMYYQWITGDGDKQFYVLKKDK